LKFYESLKIFENVDHFFLVYCMGVTK